MSKHALLSASSSKRWLSCPPSARLEEKFPNTTSVYAEEGTWAHELCEYKVKRYLHEGMARPKSDFLTEEIEQLTDIYEERILREYYDEGNGLETVMKMLPHRKKKSIINRASDLRLGKHRNLRERGVYDAVRELYGTEGGLEKFKEQFPDVNPSNYSTIARALGIAVKKEITKWTDEEIEKLKEMSEQGVSVKEQADILGKDYMCVVDKRRHIGLSNKLHRWTEEEDEILRNNQNLPTGEIQSRYLPYIGANTISSRRKRLGVAYSTIWTDEKKETFRKIYREQGAEGIRKDKEFSGMSDEWIRKKAVLLGVRGRTIYRFTEEEDAVICDYNQFRLDRLKDNLKYATSDFERDLYTQDIEYLSHRVEEDTRYKALIKWGLTQLEGRTQSVMEQLYVEGYCWDQIETESGRTLANGSVGNERSKGLKQLTLTRSD